MATWAISDRTKYVKSWCFLCYGPAALSGRRTRSAAKLAGSSAVLVLVAVSAAAAAGPGQKASTLSSQSGALGSRAHRALLDLYVLDTRLQTTQVRLSSLQAQAEQLRAQQTLLAQQLSATRRTLADSRRRLGDNLRMLYEQGDTDTLAVVLGAQSLDDAVTRLDDLTRVADQSREVVAVTSALIPESAVRMAVTLVEA